MDLKKKVVLVKKIGECYGTSAHVVQDADLRFLLINEVLVYPFNNISSNEINIVTFQVPNKCLIWY